VRVLKLWVPLTLVVVGGGCSLFIIDHDKNSINFCENAAEVLDPARIDEEGRTLTEDQSIFWADELSESMRYAEDATRNMRKIARDLADAYDDARGIADKDKVDDISQEESDRIYGELRRARLEVRGACEVVLAAAAQEGDETTNSEETSS
jgi:hypothetical protein